MTTFDTSPLTRVRPRESAGVFAPGPLAGLTVMHEKIVRRSLPIALISEFDAIAKITADHKSLGVKDLSVERAMFKILLALVSTLSIKQAQRKLLRSIMATAQVVETGPGDSFYDAAVRNIMDQRPRKRDRKKR